MAFVIDYLQPRLPTLDSTPLQVTGAAVGFVNTGFGSANYLIANLGPGPRDELITGLQKITNLPLAQVQSCIELSIVYAGWFLGRKVGIGTLLFAFDMIPCIAQFGPLYHFLIKESQGNLIDKKLQNDKNFIRGIVILALPLYIA